MELSLHTAINIFVNEKEGTVNSDRTVSYYSNTMRYFADYIKEERGIDTTEIDIKSVNQYDYQGFIKMLKHRDKLSTHQFKPTVNKPVTKTTMHTYGGAIRHFFNWLYNNEFIDKEIGSKIKLIKPEKKEIIALFKDEVELIDKQYNEKCATGLRNLIIIHLMLDMGFRVGDVLSLEIEHIFFEKRFIHVNLGKGDKDRIVPLPANLKKWLYKYIYYYRKDTDSRIVLQTQEGTDITYGTITNMIRRLKKKVELPRIKPHLFRHSFATIFTSIGGNIELLRYYMGHEDIKVTQGYIRYANTYRMMAGKDNIYRLDNIFFKHYYDTFTYQK